MTGKFAKRLSASPYGVGPENRDIVFPQVQSAGESYLPKRSKQSSLKTLRRARSFTLETLSKLTGISPSYLSRLESGARRLNTDLLSRLAEVLECQPGDLLNTASPSTAGHFTMTGARGRPVRVGGAIELSSFKGGGDGPTDTYLPSKDLPVYVVSTALGAFPEAQNQESTVDFSVPTDWVLRPPQFLSSPKAFALYVADDGYAPRYMAGDVLLVHPTKPLLPRCSVVVISKDERVLVRQFHGWAQNTIILSIFGAVQNDTVSLPKEDLKAVYKIIGTIELA